MKKLIIPCLLTMLTLTSCTEFLSYYIFGVTSAMAETTKLDLPVPTGIENKQQVKPTENTITILLGENNQVYLYKGSKLKNGIRCTDKNSSLHKELVKLKNTISDEDLVVIIKPSIKSTYTNFVNALDEMQINNIEKKAVVDLTTEEEAFLKKLNEQ